MFSADVILHFVYFYSGCCSDFIFYKSVV